MAMNEYEAFQAQWGDQMTRHRSQQQQVVALLRAATGACVKRHGFPAKCFEFQKRNQHFDRNSTVPWPEDAVERDPEGFWSLNLAVFVPASSPSPFSATAAPSTDMFWAILRPEITFCEGNIRLRVSDQSKEFREPAYSGRDAEMCDALVDMILTGVKESIRAMEVPLSKRKREIGFGYSMAVVNKESPKEQIR